MTNLGAFLVLDTLRQVLDARPDDPVAKSVLEGWNQSQKWAIYWVSEKVKDERFTCGFPNVQDSDLIASDEGFEFEDPTIEPTDLKRGNIWKVRLGVGPWSAKFENFCPVCGSFGSVNNLVDQIGTCCGYCDRSYLDLKKPPTFRRSRRLKVEGIEIPESLAHLLL